MPLPRESESKRAAVDSTVLAAKHMYHKLPWSLPQVSVGEHSDKWMIDASAEQIPLKQCEQLFRVSDNIQIVF